MSKYRRFKYTNAIYLKQTGTFIYSKCDMTTTQLPCLKEMRFCLFIWARIVL